MHRRAKVGYAESGRTLADIVRELLDDRFLQKRNVARRGYDDCGVVGVQRSAPFPLTVILTVTDTVRVTVSLGLARRAVNNFLTTEVHRSSHP